MEAIQVTRAHYGAKVFFNRLIKKLVKERGENFIEVNYTETLDWNNLRQTVQTQGMRNSNVMAIAPTATIANITGISQSIEPTYQNLFVKSNLQENSP